MAPGRSFGSPGPSNKWILLYIRRWLKTPMQLADGTLQERAKGLMQGGVISPVLSNLFLHYVFDVMMSRQYSNLPWCRYADDGLVHCNTEQEANTVLSALKQRFSECLLELHPDKSKIVYCKDDNRRKEYLSTKFTFLGYEFRRRIVKNKHNNKTFLSFNAAVSEPAKKSMRAKIREIIKSMDRNKSLNDMAERINPVLRGWINYYGKYHGTTLSPVFRHLNLAMIRWVMRKFKRFRGHKTKTAIFLLGIREKEPGLFAHWKLRTIGGFA